MKILFTNNIESVHTYQHEADGIVYYDYEKEKKPWYISFLFKKQPKKSGYYFESHLKLGIVNHPIVLELYDFKDGVVYYKAKLKIRMKSGACHIASFDSMEEAELALEKVKNLILRDTYINLDSL